MTATNRSKPLKSWNADEQVSNLANHKWDGDSIKFQCPACDYRFALYANVILEHGSDECIECGTEYSLLLVESPKDN